MSVYNYRQQCDYHIGEIANDIYLYDFSTSKIAMKFREDSVLNGVATKITGEGALLYCDNVTLSVTTESDNRFAFENKLTIKISERNTELNTNIINYLNENKLFVVFKNKQGHKFILNPELPIDYRYTFTIDDSNNENTLTIELISLTNIPIMSYNNNINFNKIIRGKSDCEYSLGKVIKLQMADFYNLYFKKNENNSIEIIERRPDVLKDIEYNKKSLQFTETYDGKDFKQELKFSIPFQDYLFYFHFNLLEYLKNRYYCILTTVNGNKIIAGNRQGMFPEYTINSDENDATIEITLSAIYKNMSLLTTDTTTTTELNFIHWEKLEGECVNNKYTYTLLQKYRNQYALNEYACLIGYEGKYTNYNIVATYTQDSEEYGMIIDPTITCKQECRITGLPNVVVFKDQSSKIFTVESSCPLTFIYLSTDCNVVYTPENKTLGISNKKLSGSYNIVVKASNDDSYIITVSVIGSSIVNREINVTAQRQIVQVPLSQNMKNAKIIETPLEYIPNQLGTSLLVQLTENTSTMFALTYPVKIVYKDGSEENYKIIQSKLYEIIVNDGTTHCFANDLWEMWLKKVGYTPDKIDINQGYIKGQIIEKNSLKCLPRLIARQSGEMCVNGKLYWIIDYVNPETSEVVKTKLSYVSTGCTGSTTQTKWVVNKDYSICQNGVSYYAENKYASVDGVTWYLVPDTQRVSNTLSNSDVCNVIQPNSKRLYKWEKTSDSFCLLDEEETIYNCLKREHVQNEYICDGKDKYQKDKRFISTLCDGKYQFYGYEKGNLIEKNSEDCGYVNNI